MRNNKVQREGSLNPTRFWVIGAGHFGRHAVDRIARHIHGAAVTVVDERPFSISGSGITTIVDDGIRWLDTKLTEDASVDMIIPAIPVHVAVEWMMCKLKYDYEIEHVVIARSWLERMPHATPGKPGQAFVSHADFICPDDCSEPPKRCTHTGRPRPPDLFRLLADFDLDDILPIVLRSYQLLPGAGGILPGELLCALDTVRHNTHRPLMVATSCRCHGVVDFLRLKRRPSQDGPFLDILRDTR